MNLFLCKWKLKVNDRREKRAQVTEKGDGRRMTPLFYEMIS